MALSSVGAAAGAVGALALADMWCDRSGVMRELNPALHPTGMVVGGSTYIGCLVGAAIILCCAIVLSYIALALLKTLDRDGDGILHSEEIKGSVLRFVPVVKNSIAIDVAAVIRHPNTILVIALFLFQGVSFSALWLLVAHRDAASDPLPGWQRGLGGAVAVFLLGFPMFITRSVHHGLTARRRNDIPGKGPEIRARVRPWDEPKPPRWLQWVLLSESGDWVSCRRTKHWVNSWQAAVRNFHASHAATGLLVELLTSWCLSFVNAFPTFTWRECGHLRAAAAIVHLFLLVFVAWRRPYRCLRDNVSRAIIQGLFVGALTSLAFAFYRAADEEDRLREEDPDARLTEHPDVSAGRVLLQTCSIAILIQIVLRMVAEGALLVKGWRAHSQTLEWGEADARDQEAETSMLPGDEAGQRSSATDSPHLFEPSSALLSPSELGGGSAGRSGQRRNAARGMATSRGRRSATRGRRIQSSTAGFDLAAGRSGSSFDLGGGDGSASDTSPRRKHARALRASTRLGGGRGLGATSPLTQSDGVLGHSPLERAGTASFRQITRPTFNPNSSVGLLKSSTTAGPGALDAAVSSPVLPAGSPARSPAGSPAGDRLSPMGSASPLARSGTGRRFRAVTGATRSIRGH